MTELLQGLPPVLSRTTRLLVLGSFPGVASLQAQQYYGHPRNHFWPIVGALLGVGLAQLPYPERLQQLRRRGLGVWDVYARCRRVGSLDQAIEDAVFNDFASLRREAPGLRWVAHNGGESARAMKHLREMGFDVLRLPSTSPANASWSFDRKLAAWREAFTLAGLLGAAPQALSSPGDAQTGSKITRPATGDGV
jgi:hypoxanthine-DNA glycosylase